MFLGSLIFTLLLLTYGLYGFYLIYVTLRVARDNGKLASMPWYAKWVAYSYLIPALLLDFVFNVIFGSLIFLEFPRQLTFTRRCSRHMFSTGRRGRVARWFCDGWLHPFEDNHCHR